MKLLLLSALFVITGCGLTEVKTLGVVEGHPKDIRYILTGEGTPTGSPISIRYETSADKNIGLQIDNTYNLDGSPSTLFIDLTTTSDSTHAAAARSRDNDRVDATTSQVMSFASILLTEYLRTQGLGGFGASSGDAAVLTELRKLTSAVKANTDRLAALESNGG